jgi:hypothetical protein
VQPNSSDDYGVVDAPDEEPAATMKPADPSDPGAWKCAECAWWEHAANAECNMCGSPKPAEKPADGAAEADASANGGDGEEREEVIEAFEADHDEDEDVDYMNLPGRDEDYMSFLQAKADGKDVQPPLASGRTTPLGTNNPFAGMDDDDDDDDEADVNVDFGTMFGGKNPWE